MKKILITLSIILFLLGIILVIPVLLSREISFIPNSIAPLSTLSNIGSYLSGTSGLFISFSGMLLIYLTFMAQIEQLNIQKKEIEDTKEQNQIERLQNTVLDMSKRVNDLINETQFSSINGLQERFNTSEYFKGYIGISMVKTLLNEKYSEMDKEKNEENYDFIKSPFFSGIEFLAKNIVQLSSIFSMIEDNTSYLRIALPLSNINPEMCNILKEMYFSGIGTNFIELSDQICVSYKLYKTEKYQNGERPSLYDNLDQLASTINVVLSYLAQEYDEKELKNHRKNIGLYRYHCMLLSQKKEI